MSKWKAFNLPARALRLLRFSDKEGTPLSRVLQVDSAEGMVAAGTGSIMGARYIEGMDTGTDQILNLDVVGMHKAADSIAGAQVIQVDAQGEQPKKATIRHGTANTKVSVRQTKLPALASAVEMTQPVDVSYMDARLLVQLAKHLESEAGAARFGNGTTTDIPVVEVRRMPNATQFWFRDEQGDKQVVVIAHVFMPAAHGWVGKRPDGLQPGTLATACAHHHKQRGGK